MEPNFDVNFELNKKEDKVIINGYDKTQLYQQLNKGHLTSYDILSQPRIINDIAKVEISQNQIDRIIREILRCSICLQLFNEPVSNKDCLHKYCRKCIEDYIRRSKRECSICRKNIETKRLMREDSKIKNLINCLIPNMDEYTKKEDEENELLVKQICNKEIEKRKNILNKLKGHNNKSSSKDNYNDKKLINISHTITASEHIDISNNSNERFVDHSDSFLQRSRDYTQNGVNLKNDNKRQEIDMLKNNKILQIKLNTEDEIFKNKFIYTEFSLPEEVTFQFIAQYLCYKQNWDIQTIDSINFYAKNTSKTKIQFFKDSYLKELVLKKDYLIMDNNIYEIYFEKIENKEKEKDKEISNNEQE